MNTATLWNRPQPPKASIAPVLFSSELLWASPATEFEFFHPQLPMPRTQDIWNGRGPGRGDGIKTFSIRSFLPISSFNIRQPNSIHESFQH